MDHQPTGKSLLTLQLQVDSYRREGDDVVREVHRRNGSTAESSIRVPAEALWDCASAGDAAVHDLAWLQSDVAPSASEANGTVRVADLFAGCGGLTLGVAEACRALGLEMVPVLAADIDRGALAVYSENFPGARLVSDPVDQVLSAFGQRVTAAEDDFLDGLGEMDLLIGGPPCQGNSDLNNHTRREDPKNELYATMARFCELVRPTHVIIENVPGVVRDRTSVAQRTWSQLEELGYRVGSTVIDAAAVGTAQRRKRSITLASLVVRPSVKEAALDVAVETRAVGWAIGDLSVETENAPFDTPPEPSVENARRMEYLFDNDLFELPNEERPDCHRLKRHSYVSVYGRLRWDQPASTITTGFGSMGRGRFVHPAEPRTLTPHEAARLQGFPDFFRFDTAQRTLLQKVIGNAVPPKLGYAVGLHLLR